MQPPSGEGQPKHSPSERTQLADDQGAGGRGQVKELQGGWQRETLQEEVAAEG
jgi:hypothetical protein